MSKLVAVFPGQGAQFVGMGKGFYDKYKVVRDTYEQASQVLGYDMADLCFNSSISQLNENRKLFPAIVTTSIGIYRQFLDQYGILPDYFLGHSLGEYGALTAAGVLEFESALKIVELRGIMATKASESGTMSIISGIEEDKLSAICEELNEEGSKAYIACFNSNTQMAVCGLEEDVFKLEEKALETGANITPMINSGPLHSPCMLDYCERLKQFLPMCQINEGEYNVISNVTADSIGYVSNEKMRSLLTKHLVCPVKWRQSIESLGTLQDPIFIEMGAKAYLKALIHEILPDCKVSCFGVKQDQEEMNNYPDIAMLKKYACSIFEKMYRIALTTLPNKNTNLRREKVLHFASELEQISNRYEGCEPVSNKDFSSSIELFQEIMKEKNVSESEQKYWINKMKVEHNYYFK